MCWKGSMEKKMCKKVFLNSIFARVWDKKDPFREAFSIAGEDFRKVKARRTSRFELEGKGYFIKLHSGIGLREYLKDVFQGKKPVTGAGQEFAALQLLKEKNIPTMKVAAFGRKGGFAPYEKSFLVTDELCDVISLEDLCKETGGLPDRSLRRKIVPVLGDTAGRMHRSGINHRDCYICHFLLDRKKEKEGEIVLYIIDLHRAQIRKKVPQRYLVKDLAGLYFSAMQYMDLEKRDVYYFLKAYYGLPLHEIFVKYGKILKKVHDAASAVYRKDMKKAMPELF